MAKKLKLVEAAVAVKAGRKVAKPGVETTGAEVKKTGKSKTPATEGRYIGKETGMRVAKYQNYSLEKNRKEKKTDEELAADWNAEFPNVRTGYTVEIVRGVRGVYNKGKHGNEVPERPLVEYDAEGNPVAPWGAKAAERRAAKEAGEEAAATVRQKSVEKKGPAKKVRAAR